MAVFAGSFSRSPQVPCDASSLLRQLVRPPGARSSAWEAAEGGASLAGSTRLAASTVFGRDGVGVAADARLDEPEALRRQLGAPPSASGAELIRAAYLRWGQDCVHRLDGDFAFVVFDARDRSVFGARDRFGVRPFVYAVAPDRLWVGSQARLLLAAGVDRRPDPWRMAEIVAGTFVDPEATAFQAIRRLPAGDTLVWEDGTLRTQPYWRPDPDLPVLRASLPETAERFRDAFDASVARRTAIDPSLGAYLSGGLDSSSVVATAHALLDRPFPLFTAVYPGLDRADERTFADLVADHVGLATRYIEPLGRSPVAEHDAEALGADEPLYMATWPMEKALLDAAREDGVRVILSGHGGDHVLHASPLGVFGDWLRTGRWRRLAREASVGAASWRETAGAVWQNGLKDLIRQRQPPALRDARRRPVTALLSPDLAEQVRFRDRLASFEVRLPTARHRLAEFVHHPLTHLGLERMATITEAMGLSFQMPYWDRALVDLCLSVPRDHLLRDGMERVLLREAMSGRLPEATRTRRTKATFDPLLNVTLRRHAGEEIAAMLDAPGRLVDWYDVGELRNVAARYLGAPDASLALSRSGDAQTLLRALTVWHWDRRV